MTYPQQPQPYYGPATLPQQPAQLPARWFKLDALTVTGLALLVIGVALGVALFASLPQNGPSVAMHYAYAQQLRWVWMAGLGGVLIGALLVLIAPSARRANGR